MTQAVVKEAWERIQHNLKDKVGEHNHRLYLKNTLLVRLDGAVAEIGVPNRAIGDFLAERFSAEILDVIEQSTGTRSDHLKFSVNGHLFRQQRNNEKKTSGRTAAVRPGRPDGSARTPSPRMAQVFNLNPRMRLENFIVGPNNRLAFNCAVEIARRPGKGPNPLFIYGGCGMGKSHLLQGVSNTLLEKQSSLRMLYVSGEYFVNQYVLAIRDRAIEQFRARFRTLDVLVIDDVHFLRDKQKSQEELLHTFTALETAGKQVVLASDSHPKELADFNESLRQRFGQGVVAQIKAPGYETRLAIIKSKLGLARERFPDAVIQFLADRLDTSVRELEGCLIQLQALANMNPSREPLTVPLVKQALSDFLSEPRRMVELADIENIVIAHYGVTSDQLHGRVRKRSIATARQVCMYLARNLTQHSLKEIGRFFGDKNHTTVVFAEQKIASAMDKDVELRATVARLRGMLEAHTRG